jgi:hypothetical protein
MKKIGVTTLLLIGTFAAIVLPGSPASASSASCANHQLNLGSSIVHQGDYLLIDESVSRCGVGLGLRVHVRQEIWGPNHDWTLGPVTTFVGFRDVVTFFTPTDLGHYTVKAWIYTMSNELIGIDSSGFDVTA